MFITAKITFIFTSLSTVMTVMTCKNQKTQVIKYLQISFWEEAYHTNSIFIKRIPFNIWRKVHQNLGFIRALQRRYMQWVTCNGQIIIIVKNKTMTSWKLYKRIQLYSQPSANRHSCMQMVLLTDTWICLLFTLSCKRTPHT